MSVPGDYDNDDPFDDNDGDYDGDHDDVVIWHGDRNHAYDNYDEGDILSP